MAILLNIRKFLRLDNEVVELDSQVVDATGLIIVEKKDFMQVQQSCFGYPLDSTSAKPDLSCVHHGVTDLHVSQH
ncbi:MAG: hypothetical protein ACHQFX_05275 [Chitinophagales bacterium]